MNRVHLIDCMEFMRALPDNHYDLAVTDPPYGIFDEKNKTGFLGRRDFATSATANAWDIRPGPEYFTELFRISKNQIIFGLQYFTADLPNFTAPIVWDKQTGGSHFADAELAFTSFPGTARIFSHQWAGAFKASERGQAAIQATQKPVALYRWILDRFARPGHVVFDSHVGSGSIRIACHDMGFDFEGCELDPEHYSAQEARYAEYSLQGQLFEPAELRADPAQRGLF